MKKRIELTQDISNRIKEVKTELCIEECRTVTEEEMIDRYILEGLKRDEKKHNINSL